MENRKTVRKKPGPKNKIQRWKELMTRDLPDDMNIDPAPFKGPYEYGLTGVLDVNPLDRDVRVKKSTYVPFKSDASSEDNDDSDSEHKPFTKFECPIPQDIAFKDDYFEDIDTSPTKSYTVDDEIKFATKNTTSLITFVNLCCKKMSLTSVDFLALFADYNDLPPPIPQDDADWKKLTFDYMEHKNISRERVINIVKEFKSESQSLLETITEDDHGLIGLLSEVNTWYAKDKYNSSILFTINGLDFGYALEKDVFIDSLRAAFTQSPLNSKKFYEVLSTDVQHKFFILINKEGSVSRPDLLKNIDSVKRCVSKYLLANFKDYAIEDEDNYVALKKTDDIVAIIVDNFYVRNLDDRLRIVKGVQNLMGNSLKKVLCPDQYFRIDNKSSIEFIPVTTWADLKADLHRLNPRTSKDYTENLRRSLITGTPSGHIEPPVFDPKVDNVLFNLEQNIRMLRLNIHNFDVFIKALKEDKSGNFAVGSLKCTFAMITDFYESCGGRTDKNKFVRTLENYGIGTKTKSTRRGPRGSKRDKLVYFDIKFIPDIELFPISDIDKNKM